MTPDKKWLWIANWALATITGSKREPDQELTSEEKTFIKEGRYTSPDGQVITFSLPEGFNPEMPTELP